MAQARWGQLERESPEIFRPPPNSQADMRARSSDALARVRTSDGWIDTSPEPFPVSRITERTLPVVTIRRVRNLWASWEQPLLSQKVENVIEKVKEAVSK